MDLSPEIRGGGAMNPRSEYGLLFARRLLSQVWIDVGKWKEGMGIFVNPTGFRPKVGDKLKTCGMTLEVTKVSPPPSGRLSGGMWDLTCVRPEHWKSICSEGGSRVSGKRQDQVSGDSDEVVRDGLVKGCRFEMVDACGRRFSIRPSTMRLQLHGDKTLTISLPHSILKEMKPGRRAGNAH